MVPGQIGGAVLVGGESKRFGSNKAVASMGSELMGEHVAAALRGAGIDPVVAIGGTSEAALRLKLVLVADQFPGEGPLGGTATALSYFTDGHVLVSACDLPLLSSADVALLCSALAPGEAAVSAVGGEPQLALACWPTAMYRDVLGAIRSGKRRWSTLLDLVPYRLVELAAAATADADDTKTLSELLRSEEP